MSAYKIELRKEGLINLLFGKEVILRTGNPLDPLELRLSLHPDCKGFVSTEVLPTL